MFKVQHDADTYLIPLNDDGGVSLERLSALIPGMSALTYKNEGDSIPSVVRFSNGCFYPENNDTLQTRVYQPFFPKAKKRSAETSEMEPAIKKTANVSFDQLNNGASDRRLVSSKHASNLTGCTDGCGNALPGPLCRFGPPPSPWMDWSGLPSSFMDWSLPPPSPCMDWSGPPLFRCYMGPSPSPPRMGPPHGLVWREPPAGIYWNGPPPSPFMVWSGPPFGCCMGPPPCVDCRGPPSRLGLCFVAIKK